MRMQLRSRRLCAFLSSARRPRQMLQTLLQMKRNGAAIAGHHPERLHRVRIVLGAGSIPLYTAATDSPEDQRAVEYRARRLALLCLRALDRRRSQLAPALASRPQLMAGADSGDIAGPLAQALLLLTGELIFPLKTPQIMPCISHDNTHSQEPTRCHPVGCTHSPRFKHDVCCHMRCSSHLWRWKRVQVWPAGVKASGQPQQRATAAAAGVLTALVRQGQLFACQRRLLQVSRQPTVDSAGDTRMAETADRPGPQPSALDNLVSTLTVRAATSSAGVDMAASHASWVLVCHPCLSVVTGKMMPAVGECKSQQHHCHIVAPVDVASASLMACLSRGEVDQAHGHPKAALARPPDSVCWSRTKQAKERALVFPGCRSGQDHRTAPVRAAAPRQCSEPVERAASGLAHGIGGPRGRYASRTDSAAAG